MQDTSTVAIVTMLASMAAMTNQAYASPWVPDLMIRAEPSEEPSAKPEETKKDESKKEEPTSSEKKNDPSPSSKADDKPTSFANAKPTSSSEPKDKSSSEKKPDPTSSSKKSEPTSSKKDDKSSSKDTSSSTSSNHGFVAPATETPNNTGSSTGSSASSSSSSGFVESGNKQSESSGMSGGAVAGVVIAVLVGVAAIAGFVILRKRRAQAARNRAHLKPDPFTMGFGSHDPPPPHTAYNMASTTPSPMIQMPTLGAGAAVGAGAAAGAYAATHNNNDNNYGAQLHDAPYGGTQLQDNSPGYSAYNTQQPQPYTQDPAAYNTNMQDPNAYNNTGMQQQQPQPATYDYGNTAPALSVNQANPGTAVSDAPPSLSPIPTHADAFAPAAAMTTAAVATGGVAAATNATAPSTSPVATPATAQPSGNSLGVFPVISTYTPTLSDELDIQPGDQVEVLVEYDDGWCQGVNLSRGSSKGVFPKHCIDFGYNQQTAANGNEQSMKRVSSMIVDQQQPQQ